MDTFLSPEIKAGIHAAQDKAIRTSGRLSVHVGDVVHRIEKLFETGFEISLTHDPKLRGSIDIYDGPKHLFQALIIYSEADGDVMRYEFKRIKQAVDQAPIDFERKKEAPIALLRWR